MRKFSFQTELQRIISDKQLVEIDFSLEGEMAHTVAYILDANDDYLTFARISNDLTLKGVTVCLMRDLEFIQVDTRFIQELSKGINDNSLHQEALHYIQNVKEFSFLGFISAVEGTKTLVDITANQQSVTGRVMAHDDQMLVLDEYYAEDGGRFARTYLNPAIISTISVGGAWLKIIERSLADKNI